jgi:hypothetical protein
MTPRCVDLGSPSHPIRPSPNDAPPHVRFTVRRMMIVVAVLGTSLGGFAYLERRCQEFQALAQYHDQESGLVYALGSDGICRAKNIRGEVVPTALDSWHTKLAEKYRHAAQVPWNAVEPDPPRPELPEPE